MSILFTIIFMIVVSLGMLWYCGSRAIIEAQETIRAIAYENRDDATIKTFDDDDQAKTGNNKISTEEASSSLVMKEDNEDDVRQDEGDTDISVSDSDPEMVTAKRTTIITPDSNNSTIMSAESTEFPPSVVIVVENGRNEYAQDSDVEKGNLGSRENEDTVVIDIGG